MGSRDLGVGRRGAPARRAGGQPREPDDEMDQRPVLVQLASRHQQDWKGAVQHSLLLLGESGFSGSMLQELHGSGIAQWDSELS